MHIYFLIRCVNFEEISQGVSDVLVLSLAFKRSVDESKFFVWAKTAAVLEGKRNLIQGSFCECEPAFIVHLARELLGHVV